MKKQILTFVALATIAVGGAIATSSAGTLNVKPATDLTPNCKQSQPCAPSNFADCEIDGVNYIGSDDQLGDCNQFMERVD